jgi:hypothetical protein
MHTLEAGVIYFLPVFALRWVLGPIRVLWAVPHFGRLTPLLFEAVINLGPVGHPAVRCGSVAPGDDRDGARGGRDVAARRNRGCPLGARFVATRVSGELCDHARRHLTAHVCAVWRDADFRHATDRSACRGNLLSLCAAHRQGPVLRRLDSPEDYLLDARFGLTAIERGPIEPPLTKRGRAGRINLRSYGTIQAA